MDSVVFGVGFAVLASLCSIAIIFSWQTRRIMIAAFGENPARAHLGARGWYVRPPDPPPEPAPPAAPGSSRPGARVAAPEPAPGSSGAHVPASGVEPAPGSFYGPALLPADEPTPGSPGPPERDITDGRVAAGTHRPLVPLVAKPAPEPFQPPSLAAPPNYAEQARRPAPDAEEVDSTAANTGPPLPSAPATGQTMRPPPLPPGEPELHQGAPETTRKPGAAPISRERPAVTPPPDLATLARDLDAADQAQADQAPEPRVPTARPPSSQQAPAASVTHPAVAPPASAPVRTPRPGIIAAGLGERPEGKHGARSERPPPHKPPQPTRKPTLLGIPAPATVRLPAAPPPGSTRPLPTVAPPAARAPEPPRPSTGESLAPVALSASASDDFDAEDEETRVGPRPAPEALGPAAGMQEAPPRRRIYPTLASMASSVPANGRPAPAVSVIEAAAVDDDDEQRETLKPGDATTPGATP